MDITDAKERARNIAVKELLLEQFQGNAQALSMFDLALPTFKYKEGSNKAHFNGDITSAASISCQQMLEDMEDHDTIEININSFGGSAYHGISIYNQLKQSGKEIIINVTGVAYSAASVVLQAGSQRNLGKGSVVGIHKASTIAFGDASDLQNSAKKLAATDRNLMDIYNDRVPKDQREKLEKLVSEDTALTAKEAIALGLADKVVAYKTEKKPKAEAKKEAPKKDEPKAEEPEAVAEEAPPSPRTPNPQFGVAGATFRQPLRPCGIRLTQHRRLL